MNTFKFEQFTASNVEEFHDMLHRLVESWRYRFCHDPNKSIRIVEKADEMHAAFADWCKARGKKDLFATAIGHAMLFCSDDGRMNFTAVFGPQTRIEYEKAHKEHLSSLKGTIEAIDAVSSLVALLESITRRSPTVPGPITVQ